MKSSNILSTLYDYQLEVVQKTNTNKKGIVCMPTGTGKTLTEAAIIAQDILKSKGKFGVYVVNAPRIMLSFQLLKEVYTFLTRNNIECRYMSVHSGGTIDISDLEQIRINSDIPFAELANGTSPVVIRDFVNIAKTQDLPLVIFSTYNSAERINDAIPEQKIKIVVNDEAQYLVQEQFHDIIHTLNSDRCYFFTATTIHTPSDKGRGMNNKDSYGPEIYKMTPREAIERGRMVRPRMHFVIPNAQVAYTREDFQASLGIIITEAIAQHQYVIGQFTSPKLLISVKGTQDIVAFMASREYRRLIQNGYKIYAVSSNDEIGNDVNGVKVSRGDFLNQLRADGARRDQKMLILHFDVLSEGVDISGITGILPLRTLSKSKFLQTFGRAARLDQEDRKRIENGEITPNDLGEMNKPYAWVIVPTILHEDADSKDHIGSLIEELRSYGFNPSEDIVSTNMTNGLPTIDGPEALNEVRRNAPNIGEFIDKVEADYESESEASLLAGMTDEEKVVYRIMKELQD